MCARNTKMHLAFLLIVVPALIVGCCGEIKAGHQSVNVEPLYRLKIPMQDAQKLSDIIDVGIFNAGSGSERSFLGNIYGHGSGYISILLDLESDAQLAKELFHSECEGYGLEDLSDITYGGSEDNQFCISYVTELRSNPDELCRPTGEYKSYVVFQKTRLVISLIQYTIDMNNAGLDDVILMLVQALKR